MLNWSRFPQIRKTDRDLELPVFFEFLERTKHQNKSALDVGAHHSADYYAERLRSYVGLYDALDPRDDPAVHPFVDHFYVADAEKTDLGLYDLVVCLSTIEHVGQYPIVDPDYIQKRQRMFVKMLAAAQKYFWISFPVGLPHRVPGEMAIVGESELDIWLALTRPFAVTQGYYWSEGPQAGYPWRTSYREAVMNQPYRDDLGTRAVCILEIWKG